MNNSIIELNEENKIIKRYTDSQKKAIIKYRANNREMYNASNKKYSYNYYLKHKDDPEFKRKNLERVKRCNERKRQQLENVIEN